MADTREQIVEELKKRFPPPWFKNHCVHVECGHWHCYVWIGGLTDEYVQFPDEVDVPSEAGRSAEALLAAVTALPLPAGEQQGHCTCESPDFWGRAGRHETWRCLLCGKHPTSDDTIEVFNVDPGEYGKNLAALRTQLSTAEQRVKEAEELVGDAEIEIRHYLKTVNIEVGRQMRAMGVTSATDDELDPDDMAAIARCDRLLNHIAAHRAKYEVRNGKD